MDGLATTLASCAAATFLVIAIYLGHIELAIILSAFLGALIGFFVFNRPEAKIYLGDAGALFIGGFLATVPFLFDWGTFHAYGYLTPIIVLAIPLLEVGTLIIIRRYKGIPFYRGSPHHFSIYLQEKGWSKYKILLYVLLMSFWLAICSFLFFTKKVHFSSVFAILAAFLVVWYFLLFYRHPVD